MVVPIMDAAIRIVHDHTAKTNKLFIFMVGPAELESAPSTVSR